MSETLNTQVASTNSTTHAAEGFLNAAAEQAKGKAVLSEQDYTNVIHEAGDWTPGQKEQFLGALSCQYVDTMYTDASWTDKYGDIFFQNSEEFGAIVQIINTEMPEVRENRAWDQITNGTLIGANAVYLPVVKEQLTGGTASWAIPFAFTGIQLDSAFKNAAGLRRFETYIKMAAENSAKYHLARMSAANRNNYIMEKISSHKAGNYGHPEKCHAVNLVEEYCKMVGNTTGMTAKDFRNNTNGCLRMVNRIFKKYKSFLTDITTLFTLDNSSNGKFIPEDRFTFTVLSDFVGLLESELYSTTFHDDFVKLKGFREIPAWQGIRSSNTTLDFDDLSKVWAANDKSVIATDTGADCEEAGVVGLMVDKWAIMHTVVKHRMGVQRDDIKDITLYEHQYTDRYINNLMLPGVVFVIWSYEPQT